MKEWQKQHLITNAVELLNAIKLSPTFLLGLEPGSFTSYEIQAVKSEKTPQESVATLLEIAKGKTDSYDELTILFYENKMTEPLRIFLEGYDKNKQPIPREIKRPGIDEQNVPVNVVQPPPVPQIKKRLDEWILGDQQDRLKVSRVVKAMDNSGSLPEFLKYWRNVATAIDLKRSKMSVVEKKVNKSDCEFDEIPQEMLNLWVTQEGKDAKLKRFVDALLKNDLKNIAEQIVDEFCLAE